MLGYIKKLMNILIQLSQNRCQKDRSDAARSFVGHVRVLLLFCFEKKRDFSFFEVNEKVYDYQCPPSICVRPRLVSALKSLEKNSVRGL